MQQVQCPHCGQSYDIPAEQVPQYAGQTIVCTSCQKPFAVPAGAAPAGGSFQTPRPPAGAQGAYAGQDYATAPDGPQQTNGWAVTSLVSGILGCFGITGIFAIVAGIIGLNKTKDPRVGGKGIAIAGIVLGCVTMLGGLCLGPAILLPSLNRAREQANRIKCAANMRQIGTALVVYANNNRGVFPPDLPTLLATPGVSLNADTFVCPSSNDTHAPGGTPAAQAGNLMTGGHLSYVYVPGLKPTSPGNAVLLYEPLTDHTSDGINVLYVDGTVDWIPRAQAQGVIQQAQSASSAAPGAQKGQGAGTDVERSR